MIPAIPPIENDRRCRHDEAPDWLRQTTCQIKRDALFGRNTPVRRQLVDQLWQMLTETEINSSRDIPLCAISVLIDLLQAP